MLKIEGKKVLIIGGGVSGKGARDVLKKLGAKADIYIDGQNRKPLSEDAAKDYDFFVISPSVTPEHKIYKLAGKREVLQEVELGASIFNKDIIGITGTNGKTTVTRLIGDMLNRATVDVLVCGNIGVSFAKLAVGTTARVAAVELSSFQLEKMGKHLKPKISIITNIAEDHLDRHKTMQNYAHAKLNIAKNQTASDTLILSFDDIAVEYLENFSPKCNVLFVSSVRRVDGAYLDGGVLHFLGEPIIKEERLKMQGEHNVKNALFAIAAAKLYGVKNSAIIESLINFEPDNHRLKLVLAQHGRRYFNDSKATNIAATKAALQSMFGSTCLILGGSDKNQDFSLLFNDLPQSIRKIVVCGATGEKILRAAEVKGFQNIVEAENLAQAVKIASSSGCVNVLFSPACASFDEYESYAERGRHFEELVQGI